MLKIISHYLLYKNLKKFNKAEFKVKKIERNNGILLVEFNSFHILHLIFAYLANYFSNKYNLKIIAFYSHILLVHNLKRNFFDKLKSYLAEKFSFGFFGIYQSFGVKNFLFPEISTENKKKAKLNFKKIYKKIKNKSDILNIKINNVELGDLIYDSYLTRNRMKKVTIDILSYDFQNFLKAFLELYFFWEEYLKNNKVKVLLVSHSIYTMGIPYRIALKKNVECFDVKENRLKRHHKNNPYHYSEVFHYREIFKKFSSKEKATAIKLAKHHLSKRFKGINLDLPYVIKSPFKELKIKKRKEKKFTILILPHDFVDAPHIGGKFAFADMYEWIKFLSEVSKEKKNINWLLKTHRKQSGKFTYYQNFSEKNIDILIKNSNIKKINSNLTHNELINNGVDLVLTVYGTAGHEYAFHGITVLNAAKMNPHKSYKFNLHISSRKEYEDFFKKIKHVKMKIDKKEVLEYYYMHYIYNSKNWFFPNYNEMLKKLGNYHDQWSINFYKLWLQNYVDPKFKKLLYENLDSFTQSKDLTFNINHLKKNIHV